MLDSQPATRNPQHVTGTTLPAAELSGYDPSPMNIDLRTNEDVAIVDFEGSLVVGVGDEVITTIVDKLLVNGYRKILLNLSAVDYIDSSGLGELVQSYKNAQRHGATLKLLQPQERVRKTLHLTMLLPLFEVHESEENAISSFAS